MVNSKVLLIIELHKKKVNTYQRRSFLLYFIDIATLLVVFTG